MTEASRARYPDEEGFVERDGVRVAYELYEGPGPTVLFAPQPGLSHSRSLKGVIPYVARHFRLVVVAARGNGRSDRPQDPAAYSQDELTADTLAVLDATATDRAIVVSWSPLALVGIKLAVEQPCRVLAEVFVTPDLWAAEGAGRGFNARRDAYADDQVFNRHYMAADWPAFVERYATRLLPHPHSTRQIENFTSHAMDTDGPTFAASVIGRRLPDRETALAMAGRIACPVLVMQNGGLAMGSKEASAALAEVTGGRLHVFPGLGPLVWARWPVVFNIALREFLESVRAGEAEAQPPSAASASRASPAGAGMPPVSAA